jgi:hypothetical protein
MSACCEGIAVIVVGDLLHEGCVQRRSWKMGYRGCVICPAFVLQLHRHQTALPHEFDSTSSIWQVKGRREVIVEEAPSLMIRIALRR